MDGAAVLERLSAQGVTITPRPNGNLWLEPASKIPSDLLELVREHKADILARLTAPCLNTITPHASHEHPWECDPASCYCWRTFGDLRFCEGAPCRWVWPK